MEINTNEVVYSELDSQKVLVPVAGHEAPGIAAFNARDFIIEVDKVSIRDALRKYQLSSSVIYVGNRAPEKFDVLLINRTDSNGNNVFSRTPMVGDWLYVIYSYREEVPPYRNKTWLCVSQVTEFNDTQVFVKINNFVLLTGERGNNAFTGTIHTTESGIVIYAPPYAANGDTVIITNGDDTQLDPSKQTGALYELVTLVSVSNASSVWVGQYSGNIRGPKGFDALTTYARTVSYRELKEGETVTISEQSLNRAPLPNDTLIYLITKTKTSNDPERSYLALVQYKGTVNVIGNVKYYDFVINSITDTTGIQGPQGKSIVIVSGTYYIPSAPPPGGPKPGQLPLPAFSDTEEATAYVVDDSEIAGQYDLYMHNVGGTSWDILDDWGGIPGPVGPQGLNSLVYTGPRMSFENENPGLITSTIQKSNFNRIPVINDVFIAQVYLNNSDIAGDRQNALLSFKVTSVTDDAVNVSTIYYSYVDGKSVDNMEATTHSVVDDETITNVNVTYKNPDGTYSTVQSELEIHAKNGANGSNVYRSNNRNDYTYDADNPTVVNFSSDDLRPVPLSGLYRQNEPILTAGGYLFVVNQDTSVPKTGTVNVPGLLVQDLNGDVGPKGDRGYSVYTYPTITQQFEENLVVNLAANLIEPSHDKFIQYEPIITDNGYYLLVNETKTITNPATDTVPCKMIKNLNAQGGGTAVVITGPDTIENGTLTQAQYDLLTSNDNNYIILNNEIFSLMDKQHDPGYLIYSHVGHNSVNNFMVKCITITTNTKAWSLAEQSIGEAKEPLFYSGVVQYPVSNIVGTNFSAELNLFNRTPEVNEYFIVNILDNNNNDLYLCNAKVNEVDVLVSCSVISGTKVTGPSGKNALISYEVGTAGTSGTPITYSITNTSTSKDIYFYYPTPDVNTAKEITISLQASSTVKAFATIIINRVHNGNSILDNFSGCLYVTGRSYVEQILISQTSFSSIGFYNIESLPDFVSNIIVKYAIKTYNI